MKCELCNDNSACVVIYIINKEEKLGKRLFLCEICANKIPVSCFVMNQNQPTPTIKKYSLPKENKNIDLDLFCHYCLSTIDEFIKSGFLGCSYCYRTFHDLIFNSALKKQPELIHHGKVPIRLSRRKKFERDLEQMKVNYHKCLDEENYEKAEYILRKLKRLETYLK